MDTLVRFIEGEDVLLAITLNNKHIKDFVLPREGETVTFPSDRYEGLEFSVGSVKHRYDYLFIEETITIDVQVFQIDYSVPEQ